MSILKGVYCILIIVLLCAVTLTNVHATQYTTTFLQSFHKWHVFKKTFIDNDKTLYTRCLCITNPSFSSGFPGFRDIPHIAFTSVDKNNYTFSLYTGFTISKNNPIILLIGNKQFLLRPHRDLFAYTYDSNDDINIVNSALKNHTDFRARIINNTGEVANDHYDFAGLDKAMQYIHRYCKWD